jgi:hypothetical protein
LARAELLTRLPWKMSPTNMVCQGVTSYESDFEPGPQVGMAYKWGGFDTEDSFLARLQEGKAAGSHSTHSANALPCATGVDCSGFVSLVWGLGQKESTSSLGKVAQAIDFDELRPGDVLNKKGSHVVLWVGKRDDGGPVFYEASGPAGKVRLNSTGSWSYLDGYEAMRFKAVQTADDCVGSTKTPIVIPRFPFKDERTMYLSCSDVFDEYNCKAGTLETGREYIYSFELPRSGEINVQVEAPEGVDIDVHILTALSSDACVARADARLKKRFQAGKYFLVADTWTNHSSIEQEGAFTLNFDVNLDGNTESSAVTAVDAAQPETPVAAPQTTDEVTCSCGQVKSGGESRFLWGALAGLVLLRRRRR